MLVEIDVDKLILRTAVLRMDFKHSHEFLLLHRALQEQMPADVDLIQRVRQQVKEYKKLTMWRE